MMTLARFVLACALCRYVIAGEFAHGPNSDGEMDKPTITVTLGDQKVVAARRLQGGYSQGGYAQPGYGQGGYQNGGNYGYGHGGYQNGGSKFDSLGPLLMWLLPIGFLLCLCFIVCQVVQCFCGELCGMGADPLIGAGLGALAGNQMGMGALPGAVAGYEMGQYMGGPGSYGGGYGGQPMY